MIVLKQNLLTFAVATAFMTVSAVLQADDLPPPPPGPYAADGVTEIAEASAVAESEQVGATDMTASQGMMMSAAEMQQIQQQLMTSYPQYYRPQIQYVYVVPMMMPKMSEEQKQQMQKQMQQMMYMQSGQVQMPQMQMQMMQPQQQEEQADAAQEGDDAVQDSESGEAAEQETNSDS